MRFEKRDFILIGASIMFMLGLSPFLGIGYALLVAFFVYFGTKVLIGRRRRQIINATGGGLCAECSTILEDKKCPHCHKNYLEHCKNCHLPALEDKKCPHCHSASSMNDP